MKSNYFLYLLIAASLTLAGCAQQELEGSEVNESNDVVTISIRNLPFVVDQIDGVSTRALVEINGSTQTFYHVNNDTIGLFPKDGYQIPFVVELPTGVEKQETVDIEAQGWKAKEGIEYAAYFPFVYGNRNGEAIPFSFLGQEQTSATDLTNLGKYSLRFSSTANYDDVTKVFQFDMKNLGLIMQLKMAVPTGAEEKTWRKVVLIGPEANTFKLNGTVNLFSTTTEYGEIKANASASTISIDLNDFKKESSSSDLYINMMLPEFTLPSGTALSALLYDTEGNAYSYTRSAVTSDKTYARGSFSSLRFNLVSNEPIETGTNTAVANLDETLANLSTTDATITVGDNSPVVDEITFPISITQSGSSEVTVAFSKVVKTSSTNTANTIEITDGSESSATVATESLSTINLDFAANDDATDNVSLNINMPSSTVTLSPTEGTTNTTASNVTHFNVVTTKTAKNTLIIESGVDIDKLYIIGGNVIIKAGAHVGEIFNSAGADSTITGWTDGGSTSGTVTATATGYTEG